MLQNFFSLLSMMRPNKLECLYLANTFQFSLTFAGNTRSLPKKEAFERSSNGKDATVNRALHGSTYLS
jgi:hypothetical protein